jgi:hypothetical protein
VLLPEPPAEGVPAGTVPQGVANATGLSGTLTSAGNLSLTAQAVAIEASAAFDLTAQNLTLTLGPAFSAGNIATLEHAELAFPAFPDLPAVALDDMSLSHAGVLAVGTFTAGDANTSLTLGSDPVLAAFDGFVLEGTGLMLQIAAGGVRNWGGDLIFSAASATLFPGVGHAGLAGAANLEGAIDVGSGALSLSASDIATALIPSVGGVLPLQIDSVALTIADPRDLDAFAAAVTGRFDFSPFLPSLGFTPILIIDGVEITAAESFTLNLSADGLRGGLARPIEFGPVTLGLAELTIPGTDAVLDGAITIGRLGANGVPQPIPETNTQVAGFVTVTGGSQFPADLQIDLLGSVTLQADGSSRMAVTGHAALDFDEHGEPLVGGAAARFTLQIDATPLAEAPFLALQVQAGLDSVTLTDIVFDLSPVIHLAVGQASFFNNPEPGGPVADLFDIVVSFPGFPEWGVTTIDSIRGFDDSGDGVIDGFEINDAVLDLSGIVVGDGVGLLELTNFQVQTPLLTFRNGTLAGEIVMTADSAVLFPGAALNASIVDNPGTADDPALRGSIDLATGAVELTVDRLLANLGGGISLEANLGLLRFAPNDASDALLFSVQTAALTIPLLESDVVLSAVDLQILRNGQFSLQGAAVETEDGVLAALGLGGLLPFDLKSVTVAALPGQRIALNNLEADITVVGLLDFSLFENSGLPTPIIQIGEQSVDPDAPDSVTVTFPGCGWPGQDPGPGSDHAGLRGSDVRPGDDRRHCHVGRLRQRRLQHDRFRRDHERRRRGRVGAVRRRRRRRGRVGTPHRRDADNEADTGHRNVGQLRARRPRLLHEPGTAAPSLAGGEPEPPARRFGPRAGRSERRRDLRQLRRFSEHEGRRGRDRLSGSGRIDRVVADLRLARIGIRQR